MMGQCLGLLAGAAFTGIVWLAWLRWVRSD